MKNISPLYRVLMFTIALAMSGCSWFGGDDEDATYVPAELTDIDKQFSAKPNWSSQVGNGVGEFYNKLAPVGYKGKVFAADSEGIVIAFDMATGKKVWSTDVGSELFGGVAAGAGIIAVGSSEAEVIVLDAETGIEKWRNLVSSEIVAAPGIGDGKVVTRTIDGKLFAMDAVSGERSWLYDRTVPSLTLRGTSSVSINRGAVVTGFSNGKIALFIISSGRAIWERRVTNPSGSSEIGRMVDADATPVIWGENVYASTFNGNITAYTLREGKVVWTRELSSYQNMSVGARYISISDTRSIVKVLDRITGTTLWTQNALKDRHLTAAVVFGDYIVAGDFEGYLHWFDKATGRLVSRNDLGGDGIVADPVVSGDFMYVYTRDGSLYSFDKP